MICSKFLNTPFGVGLFYFAFLVGHWFDGESFFDYFLGLLAGPATESYDL